MLIWTYTVRKMHTGPFRTLWSYVNSEGIFRSSIYSVHRVAKHLVFLSSDEEVPGFESLYRWNSAHDCPALHCTGPFSITHLSSRYDFNNFERDGRYQNIIFYRIKKKNKKKKKQKKKKKKKEKKSRLASKALVRLSKCTGWCWSPLPSYVIRSLFPYCVTNKVNIIWFVTYISIFALFYKWKSVWIIKYWAMTTSTNIAESPLFIGPHQAKKVSSSMRKMCGITSSCTCARSHPGLALHWYILWFWQRTAKALIRP